MSTSANLNEPSPYDSDQGLRRQRSSSRGLIMRWRVGIVLAVIMAAALGVWSRFSPNQVSPRSWAAEASSTAISPIELHPKAASLDLHAL